MIRAVKLVFFGLISLILILLAVANRTPVELRLLPDGLAQALGFGQAVSLPLFLVVFGAMLAGLILGFVWEYLREHHHRAAAKSARRDVSRLSREVAQLKGATEVTGKGEADDILALLDNPERAR